MTPNDLNSAAGGFNVPPQHQVALYGQSDATDEFPVLKAFQAYLNEEQSKARKRLMMQAIIFAVVILALAGFFVFRLTMITNRNQELTDRLIEFAMKDRSNQTEREIELKSMTDSLSKLQAQIQEERSAANRAREAQADAELRAKKAQEPTAEEIANKKKLVEQTRELIALQQEIENQKRLAAEEKRRADEAQAEAARQKREMELEAYRRKHYPELYAEKKAEPPSKPAAVKPRPAEPRKQIVRKTELSQADIDEILKAVPEEPDEEEEEPAPVPPPRKKAAKATPAPAAKPAPAPKPAPVAKPAPVEESEAEPEVEPLPAIKYYDEDYEVPVTLNGKPSKWSVPMK